MKLVIKPLFIFVASSLMGLPAFAAIEKSPLRILVVSDDGCRSEGTEALYKALSQKGYDTWLSGPIDNQSGKGTAITFTPGKQLTYEKIGDKAYCFDGTPVDSLLFGLTGPMADNKPDLVISGVNDGPNVGVNQFNSGTVGAAARAVRHGIPALAVSMGLRIEEVKDGFPSSFEYIPAGIEHTLTVVEKLNAKKVDGQPLLPAGTGLSINYPPYPEQEIKGIQYIENEVLTDYSYHFVIEDDKTATMKLNFEPWMQAKDPSITNDTTQLMRKYITYTVFQAHWNAPDSVNEYKVILN